MMALFAHKTKPPGDCVVLLLQYFLILEAVLLPVESRRSCPVRCVCQLNKVYCDMSGLRRIPKRTPPNAEYLNIRDNYIRRIRLRDLKPLVNLKHLLMKGNRVFNIEKGAFKNQQKLVSLSLTKNRLRRLTSRPFQGLSNLQVFSLRDNNLKTLDGVLSDLIHLKLFNVAGNRIKRIDDNTFRHNKELRVLDLHNNSISTLHPHSFKALRSLQYLVLRDNPLKFVELDFQKNLKLELLDLTNCQLESMVQGLPNTVNDLRLSENRIKQLSKNAFSRTRYIRLLVLNNNNITDIADGALGKLRRLYDVYLSRNHLQKIPKNLPRTLNAIYANHNNITDIDDETFSQTLNLQALGLHNNRIQTVARGAFKGLNQLRTLDLSQNLIQDLMPQTFSNMSKLELLDLSSNPLNEMKHNCFQGLDHLRILQMASIAANSTMQPAIFSDFKNLLFLDLSNSSTLAKHMAQSPSTLDYFHSVEDLNMMYDGLQGLPPDFPSHFPFLRVVKLVGNPWHCDQSIHWMIKWMRSYKVQFFSTNNMRCASPPELRGRPLLSLSKDELPTVAPLTTGRVSIQPNNGSFLYPELHNRSNKINNDKRRVEVDEITGSPVNGLSSTLSTQSFTGRHLTTSSHKVIQTVNSGTQVQTTSSTKHVTPILVKSGKKKKKKKKKKKSSTVFIRQGVGIFFNHGQKDHGRHGNKKGKGHSNGKRVRKH